MNTNESLAGGEIQKEQDMADRKILVFGPGTITEDRTVYNRQDGPDDVADPEDDCSSCGDEMISLNGDPICVNPDCPEALE